MTMDTFRHSKKRQCLFINAGPSSTEAVGHGDAYLNSSGLS